MGTYNFIVADIDNFDDFYKLKSEPNNVFWSGFDSPPSYEAFKEHYKKELAREDRTIIFLYLEDCIAGYIAIDFCKKSKVTETAHGVLSSFAGKGLGKKLIGYAVEYSKNNITDADYIIGWIAEDNVGSIKNVLSNGYTKTKEFEYRIFLQKTSKVRFDKYHLSLK